MTLAAYAATGFVVAGIHAFMLSATLIIDSTKQRWPGAILLFPSYYYLFRIFKSQQS